MGRVAYSATKDVFLRDVLLNQFIPKMREGANLNHIGGTESEIRSWQSNAPNVRNLLELSRVPDSVIVSFEYKVPNGGRIDCMLYGLGKNNVQNIIHIELKQWSNNSVLELYDNGVFMVDAFTGGTYRAVCHPSQQVANYQTHLLNFVEELNAENTNLEGIAYCYNYNSQSSPNALYANHYRAILDEHKLYSGNEIETLAKHLHDLLYNGSGLEIFNRITSSRIRQSKTLIEAAANMFKGVTEFSLLDDQITASETIFAEVEKAISKKKEKTVIVIKGGPGTGKTVIALHVLAQMAQKNNVANMYFTTRSKALRESLKVQLQEVRMANGRKANASDLIANIFNFKPCNFAENEIDLLLIDEAHRVQQSANYMGDSFDEQTYLPQVVSLMYCSKVCVFFIDDNQAIKKEEIGNSKDIKNAALRYKEIVNDYVNTDFYRKLQKIKEKLLRDITERERLLKLCASNGTNNRQRISELDAKIEKQRRELSKENCISHVKSHFEGKVNVIELELKSQFRCNGSDNYLDWLDEVLYSSSNHVKTRFSKEEYEFEVFNSPQKLYDKIKSLDAPNATPKQIARIVAGYCWRWSTTLGPDGDLIKDVQIGDFAMPWETNNVRAKGKYRDRYASSADTWAIEPQGINQVGCIFSIQGFEIDYVGVILGPDIRYDAENDCLVGVIGNNIAVTSREQNIYNRHVRNAYRVLMSRGKRGCFIYSCDPNVSSFFMKSMKPKVYNIINEPTMMAAEPLVDYPHIISERDYRQKGNKEDFLPLYSLRAACGKFEGDDEVSPEGWVDVSGQGFKPNASKQFIVHAKGDSMLPKIKDGDLCVFEWYHGGTREGEIVLTQCQSIDVDYSCSYTIKRYHSIKLVTEDSWLHQRIELHPLNKNGYVPIILDENDGNNYMTIGILIKVLKDNG